MFKVGWKFVKYVYFLMQVSFTNHTFCKVSLSI
ncbi:hypothetical protein Patl1_18369 [Pistacia atlantica]|uniref:Uncharacterized protein n=1 Tax=Pistacia atlantica TaxID=434234 RepID=A0ACC1C052_9ROSI|nr:hypothetical protein Patl1_18369 [Pistacia atlantica]